MNPDSEISAAFSVATASPLSPAWFWSILLLSILFLFLAIGQSRKIRKQRPKKYFLPLAFATLSALLAVAASILGAEMLWSPDPLGIEPGWISRALDQQQRIMIWIFIAITLSGTAIWFRRTSREKEIRPDYPIRGSTLLFSIVALFSASFILGILTDRRRGWREEAEARRILRGLDSSYIYVPDSKTAKVLSIGNDGAFADLYWIRLLAYDSMLSKQSQIAAETHRKLKRGRLTKQFVYTIYQMDPAWGAIAVLGAELINSVPPPPDNPFLSFQEALRLLLHARETVKNDYRIDRAIAYQYFQPLPFTTPETFKRNNQLALRYFENTLKTGEIYETHPELCPTPLSVWEHRKKSILELITVLKMQENDRSPGQKLLDIHPRRYQTITELTRKENSARNRVVIARSYMRWESTMRVLMIQNIIDGIEKHIRETEGIPGLKRWEALPEEKKWERIRNTYRRFQKIEKAKRELPPLYRQEWKKGMVIVDAARIPLKLLSVPGTDGVKKTRVISVRNRSIRAVTKQGIINWMIRKPFQQKIGRTAQSMEEVEAFYQKHFLGSAEAKRHLVAPLSEGTSLRDDLLGGTFKLKCFENLRVGLLTLQKRKIPSQVWSDSPFLTPDTEKFDQEKYVLQSFSDPDKVEEFRNRLINHELPPMFLSPEEARKPMPSDIPKEPEPPAREYLNF